jgi:hypothetical protein
MQIEVGRHARKGTRAPSSTQLQSQSRVPRPLIGTLPVVLQIRNVTVFVQATGYSFDYPSVDLTFSLPQAGLPNRTAQEIGK